MHPLRIIIVQIEITKSFFHSLRLSFVLSLSLTLPCWSSSVSVLAVVPMDASKKFLFDINLFVAAYFHCTVPQH